MFTAFDGVLLAVTAKLTQKHVKNLLFEPQLTNQGHWLSVSWGVPRQERVMMMSARPGRIKQYLRSLAFSSLQKYGGE